MRGGYEAACHSNPQEKDLTVAATGKIGLIIKGAKLFGKMSQHLSSFPAGGTERGEDGRDTIYTYSTFTVRYSGRKIKVWSCNFLKMVRGYLDAAAYMYMYMYMRLIHHTAKGWEKAV